MISFSKSVPLCKLSFSFGFFPSLCPTNSMYFLVSFSAGGAHRDMMLVMVSNLCLELYIFNTRANARMPSSGVENVTNFPSFPVAPCHLIVLFVMLPGLLLRMPLELPAKAPGDRAIDPARASGSKDLSFIKMAVRVGFEPTVPVKGRQFSKLVP
jgi:hypothetical protein